MFSNVEQISLHELADGMRRIADHLDTMCSFESGLGTESTTHEIFDDMRATLLKQEHLLQYIQDDLKART